MLCVTTVSYKISVNGELVGLISPSRGPRQGDPLSPTCLFSVPKDYPLLSTRQKIEVIFTGVRFVEEPLGFPIFCLQMIVSSLEPAELSWKPSDVC